MNIAHWLLDAAQRWPQRPALFEGCRQVADYQDFATRVRARALQLRHGHGIAPGERVALLMKNSCDYLELLYAIWWSGAVAVPVNSKLHPREAAWIVGNAGARAIYTDSGRTFELKDLPDNCRELPGYASPAPGPAPDHELVEPCPRRDDDLAWLFYTSGTTGRSKGVMLSHGNLMAMSLCYPLDVDPVQATDAVVYAAPMSHGAGLYNFIHVRCGARHVVPESRGFDAQELFGLAQELGQVSLFAAPTMVKRMVEQARQQGYDGAGIKTLVYGGAPMYLADLGQALDTFGPRLVQIYGQGECPMTISALSRELIADREHPDWPAIAASVGRPQSCVEVRIVDADGQRLGPGEPGEIAVRGAPVMRGYWDNPSATQEALVDGWLLTGDIGFLDSRGLLTLTDRSKDVIISGGSNIYPREVEEVLMQHPGVFEVCVVGQADAEWGESVVAFVVLRCPGGLDAQALNQWFVTRMASFKKPRKYLFCRELPKNSYGKILKTRLRQWLQDPTGSIADL
ncbi:class I adenylate-forming enzyme family protein [Pseudomonas protegens]|uniref:class I adenylate-forming enzyme family protein n=1 Tax=Pseudomonas protegens TaxID=380021 RepID=UPI000F495A39|nr:AMP-binding protein [Pseudomonas protegens]ROL90550.1 AMP-dependent synthetase [Pseudomonas protegens]ROL98087.1 AMP-dependent synthetase [Pseudomonas protegens]ROM06188.1 AMP-dependent synthetase [Pseudomonas protegens]ROM07875.1 AMP-dependent synthetase [Pseudomonas protegens]